MEMKILSEAELEFILSELEKDKVLAKKKAIGIKHFSKKTDYYHDKIMIHQENSGMYDV